MWLLSAASSIRPFRRVAALPSPPKNSRTGKDYDHG
jgi:hypothetical protein